MKVKNIAALLIFVSAMCFGVFAQTPKKPAIPAPAAKTAAKTVAPKPKTTVEKASGVKAVIVTKKMDTVTARPCTLTLAQAPKLRGFYLNQNHEQLRYIEGFETQYEIGRLAALDKTKIDGLSTVDSSNLFFQTPGARAVTHADYKDIDFDLNFLDGKLAQYRIFYREYSPANIGDFTRQLSSKIGLPGDSWVIDEEKGYASMKCKGFMAEANTGDHSIKRGLPRIKLTDIRAFAEIENRRRTVAHEEETMKVKQAEERKILKP